MNSCYRKLSVILRKWLWYINFENFEAVSLFSLHILAAVVVDGNTFYINILFRCSGRVNFSVSEGYHLWQLATGYVLTEIVLQVA